MTQQNPSLTSQESELTLRDILNVLFRQKKKIILFFFCTVLLTAIATQLMPKSYESKAQLMIRLGRENATLDPTVSVGTAFNVNESRENEINSEMELIKSREVAEKVVQVLGINRILNFPSEKQQNTPFTSLDSLKLREKAILAITKNLTTEVVKKTNVISIAFVNEDPNTAQDVITSLLGFYQEKHMAIYRPAGSYNFFEKQTGTLNSQLNAKEDTLCNLKNTTGIASIESQRTDLLSRINTLQLMLEQVNADYVASQAKIRNMQTNLENLPKIINEQKIAAIAQSSSDILHVKLNELKIKKEELTTKYSSDSRPLTDIQQQIDVMSSLLEKEEFNSSRSTAAREIQMDLLVEQSNFSALSAKAHNVQHVLDSAREELIKFNNNAVGISRLQRQYDMDEHNYRTYTQNLEQSRIDHDLKAGNLSNIAIVQASTFPIKPIKPRKMYNLLLGIFLGLIGGACLAFICEFLDHTFKSTEEIESQLKLPVLGSIPVFSTSKQAIRGDNPFATEEVFEGIRRMMHANQAKKEPPWVIGIMSCYSGEGTSTIATKLSSSLATRNNQNRVLLVDCNCDAPSLHLQFGIPLSPGFSELCASEPVVSENQNTIPYATTVAKSIDVVPAGHKNPNSVRLSLSKQFSNSIAAGKKKYSYILIDIPSLSQSTMAIELATYLDGMILVVESERVRREVIKQAISKLTRADISIFGIVVNKRKFYLPHWVYRWL